MSPVLRFSLSCILLTTMIPVFAAPETPSSDFTDNGDGTVTHAVTGLTWKRCVEGMQWDGKSCSGQPGLYNADEASKLSSTFAGQSDWRLPSIVELQSIVEREAFSPSINISVFPNTPARGTHSYSVPANNLTFPNHTWQVDFIFGQMTPTSKLLKSVARLVRGKAPIPNGQAYTPTQNFTDNGDGTLTDKTTGLTWKRCAEGLVWDGKTCIGLPTFFELGNASEIATTKAELATVDFAGKKDWRIPTINELVTIIEFNSVLPAINPVLFPNSPNFAFSSSGCPINSSQKCVYWDVGFNNTGADAVARTEAEPFRGTGYVEGGVETPSLDNTIRLVRGKQGASVTTSNDDAAKYDALTQVLTLSDVLAGGTHYQASLQFNPNNSLFTLLSSQVLAAAKNTQPANYDLNSLNLVIPRVLVAGKTYKATLLNKDPVKFVFSLVGLEELK